MENSIYDIEKLQFEIKELKRILPAWVQQVKGLIKERDDLKNQMDKWQKTAHELWLESHARFTDMFNSKEEIKGYFEKARFDNSHQGLGDIRLTVGQQEEIIEILSKPLEQASRHYPELDSCMEKIIREIIDRQDWPDERPFVDLYHKTTEVIINCMIEYHNIMQKINYMTANTINLVSDNKPH